MKIKQQPANTEVYVAKTKRNKVISDDIQEPLVNICHSAMIIGIPNSGKSNLVNSLLLTKGQYKRVFHDIFLVCPSDSRDCFGKDSALELVKDEKTYDDLSPENMEEIYHKIKANKETGDEEGEPRYSCLILDDVMADLKNKETIYWLKKLLANIRHLHCVCIISVQLFMEVPKPIRNLVRCVFQFKPHNLKEQERIHLEILPMLDKNELEAFISYCFDKPYQFFMVDRHRQLICKNFNPLEITTARGDTYPIDSGDGDKKKKREKVNLKDEEYKEENVN